MHSKRLLGSLLFVLSTTLVSAVFACVADDPGDNITAGSDAGATFESGVSDGSPFGEGGDTLADGGALTGSFSVVSTFDSPSRPPKLVTEPNGDVIFAIPVDAAGLTLGSDVLQVGSDGGLVVARFSPTQQLLWARAFDGGDDAGAAGMFVNDLKVDPSGDVYVLVESSSTSFQGKSALGNTTSYVMKLAADNGNPLWVQGFGSDASNGAICVSLALNASAAVAVGCLFTNHFTYVDASGPEIFPVAVGSFEIALLELNAANGIANWAKHIYGDMDDAGSIGADSIGGLTYAAGGRLVASGTVHAGAVHLDTISSISGDSSALPASPIGLDDGFVIKLDSPAPTLVWSQRFGLSGDDAYTGSVTALATTSSGLVLACGSFSGSSVNLGGAAIAKSNGQRDVFLLALGSTNGVPQWSFTYGGLDVENCSGIAVDPSDAIAIVTDRQSAGTTIGSLALKDPAPRQINGLTYATDTLRFDVTGKLLWAQSLASTTTGANVLGDAIGFDKLGRTVVAGNASGTTDFGNGVPSTPAGTSEAYVLWRNP